MLSNKKNYVFKGHKTLLGSKFVTFAEVELPLRCEYYSVSSDGFDWGDNSVGSVQLAFSILYQLTQDVEYGKTHSIKFTNEIISKLNSRDWVLNSSDVLIWVDNNDTKHNTQKKAVKKPTRKKEKIKKKNIVKDVCTEIGITQKKLAEILEIPEGTVSSWAVKNEIPRLGKKAIEFYIQNKRNQEIVNSYKQFTHLLNG